MSISASGIEQAIAGLNYRNPSAMKCRVLDAIKHYYDGLESPEMMGGIDTDDLVRRIWDLEDPTASAIQSKRKNLSSIKSTINADLDRAWREGRNPEGIMIGPDNAFTMSNEAKDKMIAAFSGAVSADGAFKMDEVNAALKLVSEFLSSRKDTEMAEGLEQLTAIVKKITEETGGGDVSGYDLVKKGENGPQEGEGGREKTTGAGAAAARKINGDPVAGLGTEPVEAGISDLAEVLDEEPVPDAVPDQMPALQQASDMEEYEEVEVVEEDEIIEETEEIEVEEDDSITELVDEDAEIAEESLEELPEEEDFPDEQALELVDSASSGSGLAGVGDFTGTDELPEPEEVEYLEYVDDIEEIDASEEDEEVMEETEEIEVEEDDSITELVDEDAEIAEESLEGLPGEKDLPDEEALELMDSASPGSGLSGVGDFTGADELPEPEELEDLEYVDDIEEIDVAEEDEPVMEETEEIEVEEDDSITELIDEDAGIAEEAPEELPKEEDFPDEEVLELMEEAEEIEVAEEDVMEELLDEDSELLVEALSDEDIEFVDEEVLDQKDDLDPEIDAEDGIDGVDEMVKQLLGPESADAFGKKSSLKTDNWMENVGLPVDMFDQDGIDLEHLEKDTEKKKVLAARFDGYLGVMERYYNQFITIPEGYYVVGGKGDSRDELPLRKISLPVFYFGKFPVTNAVFEIFIDRTGYVTTAEKLGYGNVYSGRFRKIVDDKTGRSRSVWNPTCTRKKVEGASWFQPLGPGSSLHNKRNHPVVQVSLKDAKSFAAWTGKRLPTEIEWEAAARTTDGCGLPWGEQWREMVCNAESSGISDTTAVNQYPGGDNPFGVSDLMGNVMEWTSDQCEPRYETERKSIFYVVKGGGWIADRQVTLLSRNRIPVDFSSNLLGFRCVVD